LTAGEAVFALDREKRAQRKSAKKYPAQPGGLDAIRMRLSGAHRPTRADGEDELSGKVNYFIGNNPSTQRANISTYAKVRYPHVYPGIDLVYYGSQQALEYDLIVAPG